jgi:hypothetical protein
MSNPCVEIGAYVWFVENIGYNVVFDGHVVAIGPEWLGVQITGPTESVRHCVDMVPRCECEFGSIPQKLSSENAIDHANRCKQYIGRHCDLLDLQRYASLLGMTVTREEVLTDPCRVIERGELNNAAPWK